MKGIILAGGLGTRLRPATQVLSKHLLNLYDKPMVYYPITVLMMAGIREIMVISTPQDIPKYKSLIGDGSQWGVHFEYVEQEEAKGIAEAFILAKDFLGNDSVCLILGDNFFYGEYFHTLHQHVIDSHMEGGHIFAYRVRNPEQYGVVVLDKQNKPTCIVEKPKQFISSHAVVGLYVYDNQVVDLVKEITPSARGELEITDLNNLYLKQNRLKVHLLSRGTMWMDTGSHESLMEASQFIYLVQKRQGLLLGSPDETAWRLKFIDDDGLLARAQQFIKSDYGQYLMELAKGNFD